MLNSFNRLPVKAAVVAGLIALGAAASVSTHPKAAPTLEQFQYSPGTFLGCDVGPGPKWDAMQSMVVNLR